MRSDIFRPTRKADDALTVTRHISRSLSDPLPAQDAIFDEPVRSVRLEMGGIEYFEISGMHFLEEFPL